MERLIEKYRDKKARGLIRVVRINNAYAVAERRFDPETGQEIDPEVYAISLDALQSLRLRLSDQIAILDEIIADLQAIP